MPPSLRRAALVLLAIVPGVAFPALAVDPGRADRSVFNECELNFQGGNAAAGVTRAPSPVILPHLGAMSLPDGLQALPPTTPSWSYLTNQMNTKLGWTMGTGDLTGDGIEDLLVSAPYYSNGEPDEGKVFLFPGSPAGLPASPSWTSESNLAGARLPGDVSIVRDVNGDGQSELLMGSLNYSRLHEDEGVAALWSWTPSGPPCRAAWVIEGRQEDAYFGYTAASAGDVNGDGYGDVFVGWTDYEAGQYGPGRTFVYLGGALGLSFSPSWGATGTQADEFLGAASVAGDVNADGFDDLLVGAPYYDHGQVDEGGAFLYMGSAAGLSAAPVWSAEGNQNGPTYFGVTLASGDVNGDGFADMMIGAYEIDIVQTNDGGVFVYHGSASGLSAVPNLILRGPTMGFELAGAPKVGNTMATGDVNGDGFDDLLVGASLYTHGQLHEGGAFLYLGSAGGLSSTPAWSAESDVSASEFGNEVALADLNADGLDDVIVGAWGYSAGEPEEGAVFVYLTQAPAAAAGRVPESAPLTVQSLPGGDLQLSWGASCLPADSDYEIYEGMLGSFDSHTPCACSTGGMLTHQLTPSPGDRYYLVVPRNSVREGSYGLRSDGSERPASVSGCAPQAVAASCPGP